MSVNQAVKRPLAGKTLTYARGTRNVIAQPKRKLIFGVGNYFYPRSRFSIGIWALEHYAKKRNFVWEKQEDAYSMLIDRPEFALAKPQTFYVEENGRAFFHAADTLKIPFDRCVVIHHNVDRELGDIELHFGGRTDRNAALIDIFNAIGSENFPRISVGVGHPESKMSQARYLPTWNWSDNHYRQWFLMNKFPVKERELIRTLLLPKIEEMIDIATKVESREQYYYHMPGSFAQLEEEYERVMGRKAEHSPLDPDDAAVLARQDM